MQKLQFFLKFNEENVYGVFSVLGSANSNFTVGMIQNSKAVVKMCSVQKVFLKKF